MRVPRFGKSVSDPQARRQLMEQAVVEARAAYRFQVPEKAREPILRLQDQFDEAGIERLELLFHAEANLSSDAYWLNEIVTILLRKPSLTPQEIPYLQRSAMLAVTRLDLWVRLFRERKAAGNEVEYYADRESCALALLPYFPPDGREWGWPDKLTEEEAFNLMGRCLYDAATSMIDLRRLDSRARDILRAAMVYYPERRDFRPQLARIAVADNERNATNIGLVMEAVLENPSEVALRIWAAESLLSNPRLFEQGLAMLRQLHAEHPYDRTIFERYISAIKACDALEDEDEEVIATYATRNTEDLRALEMLADHYVARSLLTDEALQVYRLAAASSPKRRNYLRLMGKFYASRSEWSDVIAIFHEMREGGADSEDVILPLAMAYAEFDRSDEDAIAVYRRAIEMGSLMPGVHSNLCRYLYRENPLAADSIAQFTQTLTVVPDCVWAELGLILHYLETGDPGRAMDSVVSLLNRNPMDREAMRLGGRALALDYSRRGLARLAGLKPFALHNIFEEAYVVLPDAGPIALGVARHRIANGVRNAETIRLLGDVCRRNPDAVDLRIARGDMMWDLGQEANAVGIYRELLERWRGAGALPRGVSPLMRSTMLQRVARFLLQPPGPGENELDVLLEASGESDCPPDIILGTARTLVGLEIDHPEKLQLLSLAMRLAPEDRKLERAWVEGFAAKGNPRPAIELAIRMMEAGDNDEEVVSLLRSIQAVTQAESLPRDLVDALQEALHTSGPPPTLLLAGMELVFMGRPATADDAMLLEALAEIFPRNVRVRRFLARALSDAGETERASELLASLVEETPEDDVVLELAKTHARLGKQTRENYKIAEMAARIDPMNVDLQIHLAGIEFVMGSLKSGARRLMRVMQTSSECLPRVAALLEHIREGSTKTPEILFLLADVHIRSGRIEQALGVLARLNANYQLHYSQLIDFYERMIALAPENPRPYVERGILYRLIGQLLDAVDDFRAAHKLAPENTDIASEFADVLTQKLRADTPPRTAECLEGATLYLEVGDEEAAFELVDMIIKREPANQDALRILAQLQLNAGALLKCQYTIRQLEDKASALDLMQRLARAFADDGEHLAAAQVMTEAIEVGGPRRDLLQQLRSLHEDQARHSKEAAQRLKILHTLSNRAQGRYDIREEIGSGSMGVVYKAYDRELDELVVLKILPEHFANNEEALARFRHEAKAARKLAHPNIVRIHDFGEEAGRKHISMEWVSGGDLKTKLSKVGRFSEDEAINVVRDVGRALAHAHGEGVLHRDIKTANILLSASGRVKLSDFGIAALLETRQRETDATSGATAGGVGTPLYMSPEQFEGNEITRASDIYSLGVLFYELLAGAPPFVKGSIAYHHQFTAPRPIPDVQLSLWRVIERMLAKIPADRYDNAEELLAALDQFKGRSPNRQIGFHDQVTPPFGT